MTPTEQDKELREKLTKLISQDGWVDTYEVDVEGQVAAIQTIIRNEKLKLLAEVRERVVGEKKDQEYRLIDTEYASTRKEKVYLSDGISRNKLRNEQIAELTKLEAEL